MGLLDVFNSEEGQSALGLLAAAGPRFDGAGFGQRLQEGLGAGAKWKAQQQEIAAKKQTMEYQQMLMADHAQKLIAEKRANELAARKQAELPNIYSSPSAGSPAMNFDQFQPQGTSTGLPSQAAVPASAGGVNVQRALIAGYSPDEIAKLDGLRNVGLNKVERTIEGKDPVNGAPMTFSQDAYGRSVGSPIAQWRAPMPINRGGSEDLIDPTNPTKTLASFAKTQTPDSIASNWVSRQNHKETLDQAKVLAGYGPDGQTNENVESMAKMIAEGKMAPPSGFAAARPVAQAIMRRVSEINPNYDATDYAAKTKAAKDFTSGTQGNAMRSFAVAGQHLDQLGTLVDALDNRDLNVINKVANAYAQQTGGTAPTNFAAAKDVVSKEVIKAIVGSGGGVEERKELAQLLNAAQSPAQLKGVIAQYRGLMDAQHNALLQQRRAAGLPDSTLPNYGAPEISTPKAGSSNWGIERVN